MTALNDTVGELVDAVNSIPELHAATRDDMRAQLCYVGEYGIGERVRVDGDGSIVFVISALFWDGGEPDYRLSWFANGVLQQADFAEWRLSRAEWRLSRAEGGGDAEPPRQQQEAPAERAPIIGFTGRSGQ